MKTLLTLTIVLLSIAACKKKDPLVNNNNCATNYTLVFENELNAVNNAASVYAMDPTVQNCEAYKVAAQEYVDALESWDNCAGITGQRVQWQASVDAARVSVDAIECE